MLKTRRYNFFHKCQQFLNTVFPQIAILGYSLPVSGNLQTWTLFPLTNCHQVCLQRHWSSKNPKSINYGRQILFTNSLAGNWINFRVSENLVSMTFSMLLSIEVQSVCPPCPPNISLVFSYPFP